MPTAHARPKGLAVAGQKGTRPTESSKLSHEHEVLELQRLAGNAAVSQLLDPVQRNAATAVGSAAQHKDYVALLDGFQDLAVAAIDKHGKTLDTVHLGTGMSAPHHVLLEQVRRVLILAQEASADSRATAVAQWPGLATKLQKSLGEAKQAGVAYEEIATVADIIPLVGENYVKVRHAGAAEAESFEDYRDLFTGMQLLLDTVRYVDKSHGLTFSYSPELNRQHQDALKAVSFGGHLSRRHLELLSNLRYALLWANVGEQSQASSALNLWQAIQGDLQHVFRRAKNYLENDLSPIQKDLSRVGREVIHGAVYTEAHKAAREHTDIEAPDLAFDLESLKDAVDEFMATEKLAEKTNKLTKQGTEHITQDVINEVLGGSKHQLSISGSHGTANWGKAIMELVKGPGEIKEKWEALKKKGVLPAGVAVAELVSKINGFVSAGCEMYLNLVKNFAEHEVERLAEVGGEALSHWKEIAKTTEERLGMLEKVGKAAVGLTVVIGFVKFVDAIWHRQWGKAVKVGVETGADVIGGFAVGAGGAAMVGGIEVVIWAEAEGLKGAVAMKEWCEKGAIRDAAWDFINVCKDALEIGAEDFVANVKLLSDPSVKGERAHIEKDLESYQKYWLRYIEQLSDQFMSDRTVKLGGQPGLMGALGYEGMLILRSPGSWAGSWESTVHQMQVMFAGASRIAKYVVEHYPKKEKKKKPEEGEGEAEE